MHYSQFIKLDYKQAKMLIPCDKHSDYIFIAGTHLESEYLHGISVVCTHILGLLIA